MKYNLAFKYRIYPNKDQELLINKTFGCVRFVYNTILYIANKIYEETGKNIHASVAQLDRASDYGSEGYGFNSCQVRHFIKYSIYIV